MIFLLEAEVNLVIFIYARLFIFIAEIVVQSTGLSARYAKIYQNCARFQFLIFSLDPDTYDNSRTRVTRANKHMKCIFFGKKEALIKVIAWGGGGGGGGGRGVA